MLNLLPVNIPQSDCYSVVIFGNKYINVTTIICTYCLLVNGFYLLAPIILGSVFFSLLCFLFLFLVLDFVFYFSYTTSR